MVAHTAHAWRERRTNKPNFKACCHAVGMGASRRNVPCVSKSVDGDVYDSLCDLPIDCHYGRAPWERLPRCADIAEGRRAPPVTVNTLFAGRKVPRSLRGTARWSTPREGPGEPICVPRNCGQAGGWGTRMGTGPIQPRPRSRCRALGPALGDKPGEGVGNSGGAHLGGGRPRRTLRRVGRLRPAAPAPAATREEDSGASALLGEPRSECRDGLTAEWRATALAAPHPRIVHALWRPRPCRRAGATSARRRAGPSVRRPGAAFDPPAKPSGQVRRCNERLDPFAPAELDCLFLGALGITAEEGADGRQPVVPRPRRVLGPRRSRKSITKDGLISSSASSEGAFPQSIRLGSPERRPRLIDTNEGAWRPRIDANRAAPPATTAIVDGW